MHLLIDMGNSRMKWALADHKVVHQGTVDYTEGWLKFFHLELKKFIALTELHSALVCNVSGEKRELLLREWLKSKLAIVATTVTSKPLYSGLKNNYTPASQLGADRWAALFGAYVHYPLPVIVCDIGTAVTIDTINREGQFTGGTISPGLRLMYHSLFQNTSMEINRFNKTSYSTSPLNTESAIASGLIESIVGQISLRYLRESQSKAKITLVITGGDAPLIAEHLLTPFTLDTELLFKGMIAMKVEK